jgi:peptide/nickel transport system substrate-binding protein
MARTRLAPSLALAALAAGCNPGADRHDPVTLVVGRATDAINLDPAGANDVESDEVVDQIFETLVRTREGGTEIEPGLAEAWEVAPLGTEWTFHLRHGVKFHDGTPCNADAVVFSLDRQRDPRHPFHVAEWSYWESTYRNIVRVDKVDDSTVKILI